MADKKISQLTAASTPLAGTEVLPIVQSGSTVKVAVSDLTAGRSVSATNVVASGSLQTQVNGSTAIANALNDNLVITVGTGFTTFTGGGALAQLGGMVAGVNGQRLVILNSTGAAIPIIGESATSTAANRIWTQGLAPAVWNNLGTREFIYKSDGGQPRWLMIGSNAN